MTTAAVILAAGRSSRFGAADKLLAPLQGRPLASYAAAALMSAPVELRAAVCGDAVAPLMAGMTLLSAPPGSGQADSLRAAVDWAGREGASRLLVLLADMPFVTADDLTEVLERAGTGMAAATDGARRMPPACFPATAFPALAQLDGDAGARPLLAGLDPGRLVHLPATHLRDIDTAADLAAATQA